jgi:undecaprenyl-diphosphatase
MTIFNTETIQLGVLSIVQGLTELLPVSSSGHLILVSRLWEAELSSLILSILHIGTTLAIILFLRKTLFKNLISRKKLNFYLKILIASIPAGLVGIFLGDLIEKKLRATWIIATSLILWGIVMIITERLKVNEQTSRTSSKKIGNEELINVNWKQALAMGFAQVLALVPGTSRSGITTLAGIFSGLNKYVALEYSFILGLPVLAGASVLEIGKEISSIENLDSQTLSTAAITILPAIFLSFSIGYIALLMLKKYQKENWLTFFGIYRILLGLLILTQV